MSTQVKPVEQLEFKGVNTSGNPIQRPRNTAQVCRDFRVMPGNWLRLRAGREARYNLASGSQLVQLAPFRRVDYIGNDYQLAQVKSASDVRWHWFQLGSFAVLNGTTDIETIATAYDGAFSNTNAAAICNLNDRPVFYNGLGVRNGSSSSKPPFSYYYSGNIRYFGLDCYAPSSTPSLTYAIGSGYNKIAQWVTIYVGLYNTATGHYSNGVFAGKYDTPQGGPGTMYVNNLAEVKATWHDSGEQAELKYVFYATIDGGQIPYLILNAALDGPFTASMGDTSAALSITSGTTNGWVLDLTKEMPTENFPPRPMRTIAYANGRLYGALMSGGSGSAVSMYHPDGGFRLDFTYIPTARELAAVVWSAAASDSQDRDFLGDPLQSWPFFNIEYTPSGDQPTIVFAAPDGDVVRVFVGTPSATFFLEEQVDGIHTWRTISRVHGVPLGVTVRVTRYGLVWVDQRNQIVLLKSSEFGSGKPQVDVLSNDYQSLLVGTVQAADYVYDPLNLIERYQVWLSGSVSVVHDFVLGGQGYSFTNCDYTAAMTAVDGSGRRYHIVGKTGIYTHEYQPDGGYMLTYDQTFATPGSQTNTPEQIAGLYIRNWDDFGDSDVRKELPLLDLIGDVPTVEWWADFEEASAGNKKTASAALIPQSTTTRTYRAKFANSNHFWYKIQLKVQGNSGTTLTYPDLPTDGDHITALNFYGSIMRAMWRIGVSQNR